MKKELTRQGLHLLLGLIVIYFLLAFGRAETLMLASILLLGGTLVGFAVKKNFRPGFIYALLKHAERSEEKKVPGKGPLTFIVGVLLALSLFPSKIALGALIVLVFGDSFSTLVGKKFGKTKLPAGRSLEGTLAGVLASFLAL
ncbi:hypothetical protein HZB89_00080, partial [archaeon]|nr:hypothetical protein [archaeon]